MMSWKSPPKALHSFSIPASIFPQARKNPQLPNTQTFFNLPRPKKKGKKDLPAKFWNIPTEESMVAFLFNMGDCELQHPEGKVHR